MSAAVDWHEVRAVLDALYSAIDRLETMFPGRKFTLDGHLVGSVGEVLAAYMFDLDLVRGSNKGHDAKTRSGRNVEIKLTQGNVVAIRHEPEHLLVLQRQNGMKVRVVFNGPGALAWESAGKMQRNGQRPISLQKLSRLNERVGPADRLDQCRDAPV
jgi:hypothetical protein